MRDPNRPPKPGRGFLIRALIAGILTVSLSATAVASAVLLEVHDVVETFTQEGRTAIDIPEVTRAEAGDPRTFLLAQSAWLRTRGRSADRREKALDGVVE